jgi:hypothetical protein
MLLNINRCGKTKVMRISRQQFPIQVMIDQIQPENVEHFNYLCSKIIIDARCTCKIKTSTAMSKAAFNEKITLLSSKSDLNLRNKLVKWYTLSRVLYGAENWTLQKVDQKYLVNFEMWCCKRMSNE